MLAIPNSEYTRRIKRFQENIRAAGLDAALVHANEADFANVRYLSEYWPTFEAAGVFVPAEGSPELIIGPESEAYARTRSKIKQIALMVEYRESAEPEYPGIPVAHFKDVVKMAMPGKKLLFGDAAAGLSQPVPRAAEGRAHQGRRHLNLIANQQERQRDQTGQAGL
jgi:Xaa-Pro aminopeptidase